MNIVKKALAITAIVLASFSVSATLIGGVTWDPDHSSDASGKSDLVYQEVVGGVLSGYGRITQLNGLGMGDFCPGCELTYHFGGFVVDDDGGTPFIEYKEGWMNLWVDTTPDAPDGDADLLTAANTGDDGGANALWLSLVGHIYKGEATTFEGGLVADLLLGVGYLDVSGGLAAWHFDTDSIDAPNDTTADFSFTSSFSDFEITEGGLFGTGTLNFKGDSIPEPATLGIFALALISLAVGVRNKRT